MADIPSVLISSIESLLGIAREELEGKETDIIFGRNADLTTAGTHEDVWPVGGDYPFPTAAAKVAISSSHAADTAAGLGVRSVEIHGLSATGADQDEIIATNGTTEVESTLDYIRINKMHSETCGTVGGSHQGNITCRVTSAGAKSGDKLAEMEGSEGSVDSDVFYGSGESKSSVWTVPLGKIAYLIGGSVFMDAVTNKTGSVFLMERENILDVSVPVSPRRELWSAENVSGAVNIRFDQLQKVKPLTDIWFRAVGAANGTAIEVELFFYLLDVNAEGK
jgi:hypothetical protein